MASDIAQHRACAVAFENSGHLLLALSKAQVLLQVCGSEHAPKTLEEMQRAAMELGATLDPDGPSLPEALGAPNNGSPRGHAIKRAQAEFEDVKLEAKYVTLVEEFGVKRAEALRLLAKESRRSVDSLRMRLPEVARVLRKAPRGGVSFSGVPEDRSNGGLAWRIQ